MESSEVLDLKVAVSELTRQRDHALAESVSRTVQLGSTTRQNQAMAAKISELESQIEGLLAKPKQVKKAGK